MTTETSAFTSTLTLKNTQISWRETSVQADAARNPPARVQIECLLHDTPQPTSARKPPQQSVRGSKCREQFLPFEQPLVHAQSAVILERNAISIQIVAVH